jgi:hypothetical protein
MHVALPVVYDNPNDPNVGFSLNKLSENAFLNGNDQDQCKTNPNLMLQFLESANNVSVLFRC